MGIKYELWVSPCDSLWDSGSPHGLELYLVSMTSSLPYHIATSSFNNVYYTNIIWWNPKMYKQRLYDICGHSGPNFCNEVTYLNVLNIWKIFQWCFLGVYWSFTFVFSPGIEDIWKHSMCHSLNANNLNKIWLNCVK